MLCLKEFILDCFSVSLIRASKPTETMIEIDGKAGGGQILRTALSMSAINEEDFRIENIRGSRSDPGLKHQHVECVETVARLCDAEVKGAELGSEELVFRPAKLEPENFTANIGTAGSITLLLDSVLPLVTQFDEEFRLTVKGGTHVRYSPMLESFEAKLELLKNFGLEASVELEKAGYYPKGGGKVTFRSQPSSMETLNVEKRGGLKSLEICSKASLELESSDVADRQADELARKLKSQEPSLDVEKNVEYVQTDSTGSSLVLKAFYENSVAAFDALGERGKRSEEVAYEVFKDFKEFDSSNAAVDRHIADQLMTFLAVVGGRTSFEEVTPHVQTNLEVLRQFGADINLETGKICSLKSTEH